MLPRAIPPCRLWRLPRCLRSLLLAIACRTGKDTMMSAAQPRPRAMFTPMPRCAR